MTQPRPGGSVFEPRELVCEEASAGGGEKQMQENLGLRSDMMSSRDEESQRPFLEQNEKLQGAESELEILRRALREKDLKVAELQNELDKSISPPAGSRGYTDQFQDPMRLKKQRQRDFELNMSAY